MDKVLRMYLGPYKVEHIYRLMKSGMGVDTVYVQTPSRANALLFVIDIATLASSIMDDDAQEEQRNVSYGEAGMQ